MASTRDLMAKQRPRRFQGKLAKRQDAGLFPKPAGRSPSDAAGPGRLRRSAAGRKGLYPQHAHPARPYGAFTLLVAVLLSAQCTDRRVNLVTPALVRAGRCGGCKHGTVAVARRFKRLFVPCGACRLRRRRRSAGLCRRSFWRSTAARCPATFEELEALPGVGHKTACVVMAQAFGFPRRSPSTLIFIGWPQRWKLTDGARRGADRGAI